MHPLGSGEHLVAALRASGVEARSEREDAVVWEASGQDARAAVDAFMACAREPAVMPPDDEFRLCPEPHSEILLYEAIWDGPTYVLSFRRQFSFEDGEGEFLFLHRLHLELVSTAVPSDLSESDAIYGAGGSAAGVDAWFEVLSAEPGFMAVMSGPVDRVLFDQGQI